MKRRKLHHHRSEAPEEGVPFVLPVAEGSKPRTGHGPAGLGGGRDGSSLPVCGCREWGWLFVASTWRPPCNSSTFAVLCHGAGVATSSEACVALDESPAPDRPVREMSVREPDVAFLGELRRASAN